MDLHSYWKKQTREKPLYPDIEWNKPEQRSLAGRLAIIGGNKLGFAGVGGAYQIAKSAGVGELRVLLPDVLKKAIPTSISDTLFAPTNPSGGLSSDAINDMKTISDWANGVVFIGDAGRNSETAILYERFVQDYKGQLTITRDAFDLLKNTLPIIVERPDTLLVLSFAQLQKMFQSVYYPKMITFSMQLAQAVEAVHKFTITYPATIVTFHQGHLIIAHNGDIVTMAWENPMAIWKGSVAMQAAVYWLWTPGKPLQAITTSTAVS